MSEIGYFSLKTCQKRTSVINQRDDYYINMLVQLSCSVDLYEVMSLMQISKIINTIPVVSDITLEARWTESSSPTPAPPQHSTPSSYTVSYHAIVDGTESNAITVPPSATVQAGSTLQTPSDPTTTDTSLVFIGWSTSDTEYVALVSRFI